MIIKHMDNWGTDIWFQDTYSKSVPKIKKCKKVKWLSEEALLIAEKRREGKDKGEKER